MFEDINAFCAIAKHHSFSKAAREIGISTPVITRRLARLEETLETRLLNRTTRQVTLTEAGNLFYTEVSDILNALEASKDSVKSLMSQVSGTLKVGMPNSLSQCYVVPALKAFKEKYPNLNLHIVSGNNLSNLLNNGFDLIIQCGQMPDSNLYYKPVGTMHKILAAAPEYLAKHGTPQKPEDLQTHNCLINSDFITNYWKIMDKGKIKEIPVSGDIKTNDYVDLKRLAIDGMGIIYMAKYAIYEELKNGKLVSILNDHQLIDHTLYAIYPTKKYLAKKTQIFLEFITELLANVCLKCPNK